MAIPFTRFLIVYFLLFVSNHIFIYGSESNCQLVNAASKSNKSDSSILGKPRFLWIDATANFADFANSKENILRDLTLAKKSGFTHVVVDVRLTSGNVLFSTNKVEQVTWVGAWRNGVYTKITRTATWDYLQAFIEAGRALGLKVYAGFNTFVGGQRTSLGNQGLLFSDQSKKEWATEVITDNGIVNVLDQNEIGTKFLNPINDQVREYLLGLLEDLAFNYPELDGIILDRGRFAGLQSDFSSYSRNKFEQYIGQKVQRYPDDIMTPEMREGALPENLPVHFKKWLEFRVKIIHDFMSNARNRIKLKNPNVNMGVYVGGWYSSYYGVGVNWASKTYDTSRDFPKWATNNYKNFGYADLMDIMLIGAYASPDRVFGTTEWTIQGFCSRAKDKIKNDAIVVGGPDIGNGNWAGSTNIPLYNDAIISSVEAVNEVCDGYFLFDMIHLKNRNQWQYVHTGVYGYTVENNVLVKWDNASGDIIVPERVDSIGPLVFQYNADVVSVNAQQVKGIGNGAFQGCENLQQIEMPSLKIIGDSAFRNMKKLSTLNLQQVEKIGGNAFRGDSLLSSVILPNVKELAINAFRSCSSLTTIDMPQLKIVGQAAFWGTSINQVELGSAEFLDKYAFYSIKTLESIRLPNVKVIKEGAFHNSLFLRYVDLSAAKELYEVSPNNTKQGFFTFPNETLLTVYVSSQDKIALFPINRKYDVTVKVSTNQINFEELGYRVFPNPSREWITVTVPQHIPISEINVRDVSGRTVINHVVSGSSEKLNVSGLTNGIYFVQAGHMNVKLLIR